MSQTKNYIAVDLGAESGRVMLATIGEDKLELQECHRFPNGPTVQDGSMHWDFDKLFNEIKTGIAKTLKEAKQEIAGIGVDTWGVDYGLIDSRGELIENPYHYRDSRTDGMLEKAYAKMPREQIYNNTGIQFMQLNTVYQLLAMRLANDAALAKAKNLIFMADLIAYKLCGEIFAEYSLASTSQLMDMNSKTWSKAVFEAFDLPMSIMPKVVQPGTVVGRLTDEIASELDCASIPVIAVGSHDTACAVAGVPVVGVEKWAYLSSGTWSLMGLEIPDAIINKKTYEYQFTNEGGVNRTIRLLKNIMGLWLVQECRRQWQRDGVDLSYAELTEMAERTKPFAGFVNPDYQEFFSPGDMPAKINQYLSQTGQNPSEDKGQIIRMVLESLAFKYRWVMDKLEDISGRRISVLHIVGGGIQNELLCQFAANATGKKVIAGPVEATASGNIIIQAMATGQIASIEQGREIIRKSNLLKQYQPMDVSLWDEKYKNVKW
jgi:sugar (pentulose or hexulose) kinase